MNLVGACMHFRNEQVIFNFFVLHTMYYKCIDESDSIYLILNVPYNVIVRLSWSIALRVSTIELW